VSRARHPDAVREAKPLVPCKPLVQKWWISLTRTDGLKERRTAKSYSEAKETRRQAMASGRYEYAWIGME